MDGDTLLFLFVVEMARSLRSGDVEVYGLAVMTSVGGETVLVRSSTNGMVMFSESGNSADSDAFVL